MDTKKIFVLSEEALTNVIDQISDEDWSKPVPLELNKKGGDLRDLIKAQAYDDAWVSDVLAGKTIAEVGTKHDGDLLGDNPKNNWHKISELAITAVGKLDNPEDIVHISYGDLPASEYLWHISTYRALQAVDIARFIGVNDDLNPELVKGLWDILQPNAEKLREWGVFGPEVKVDESADLQSRLLGLTGRQP